MLAGAEGLLFCVSAAEPIAAAERLSCLTASLTSTKQSISLYDRGRHIRVRRALISDNRWRGESLG